MIVLLVFLTWVAKRTTFGRHVYAVGGNAEAARRAGINVTRDPLVGVRHLRRDGRPRRRHLRLAPQLGRPQRRRRHDPARRDRRGRDRRHEPVRRARRDQERAARRADHRLDRERDEPARLQLGDAVHRHRASSCWPPSRSTRSRAGASRHRADDRPGARRRRCSGTRSWARPTRARCARSASSTRRSSRGSSRSAAATATRRRPSRRGSAGRRSSTDWREQVADERIGLFVNGGPNALHAEPTIAAARAGKHVLCEKPLALDAAQAHEMWRAAADAGVVHVCGFNYRFVPGGPARRASSSRRATLGDLVHFRARYLQSWGWDAPTDVVALRPRAGRDGRDRRPRRAHRRPRPLPRRRDRDGVARSCGRSSPAARSTTRSPPRSSSPAARPARSRPRASRAAASTRTPSS